MAQTVVVFDFDKTLINCDSDDWVIREFGLAELFKQLMFTMPWNSLMVSPSLFPSVPFRSSHLSPCLEVMFLVFDLLS